MALETRGLDAHRGVGRRNAGTEQLPALVVLTRLYRARLLGERHDPGAEQRPTELSAPAMA
jgi:hypothetical protein